MTPTRAQEFDSTGAIPLSDDAIEGLAELLVDIYARCELRAPQDTDQKNRDSMRKRERKATP